MKLSEIARVNIKQDSSLYNTMKGCDMLSQIQQGEIKAEDTFKKNKNINKKSKGKR
jgi:hypothetical protein